MNDLGGVHCCPKSARHMTASHTTSIGSQFSPGGGGGTVQRTRSSTFSRHSFLPSSPAARWTFLQFSDSVSQALRCSILLAAGYLGGSPRNWGAMHLQMGSEE